MAAPLRRYTDLAMRPAMAAAAWFGFGRWWHHARLWRPVPWALADRTLVPRRCYREGHLAPLGIGETWTVLSFINATTIIFGTMLADTWRSTRGLMQRCHSEIWILAHVVLGLILMVLVRRDTQCATSFLRDLLMAISCGPPRSGVGAPMRRHTDPAMRPVMAAVAWLGLGMR